jgi:hypothetical protein
LSAPSLTADFDALAAQQVTQHPAARERVVQMQRFNPAHDRQLSLRHGLRFAVKAAPAGAVEADIETARAMIGAVATSLGQEEYGLSDFLAIVGMLQRERLARLSRLKALGMSWPARHVPRRAGSARGLSQAHRLPPAGHDD